MYRLHFAAHRLHFATCRLHFAAHRLHVVSQGVEAQCSEREHAGDQRPDCGAQHRHKQRAPLRSRRRSVPGRFVRRRGRPRLSQRLISAVCRRCALAVFGHSLDGTHGISLRSAARNGCCGEPRQCPASGPSRFRIWLVDHSAGRLSNGRIEGTNNLLQVLRRKTQGESPTLHPYPATALVATGAARDVGCRRPVLTRPARYPARHR